MKLKPVMFILIFALVVPVKLWAAVPADQVTKIYVATFNRAPDAGGLNFWANTSGLTIEGIAAEFFKAPETQRKYPEGTTDAEFVNTIYQNVFGRDAEQAGRDYWVNVLGNGYSTRDQMIMTVIDGARNKDLQVLLNKTDVGLYFAVEQGLGGIGPFSLEDVTSVTGTVATAKQAINVIAGGPPEDPPGETPTGLEADIESYMAMISSAGDLSPMVEELVALLGAIMEGDSSVVTITPALDNIALDNIPQNITITANFGNGYIPAGSSAVYTGLTTINITGISNTQTGISANVNINASNVQRDNVLVLDGIMTMGMNVEGISGNTASATVNINFSNLTSLDFQLNGGIALNIPAISSDTWQLLQPVTLTLNQLATLNYLMNGTVTMTQSAPDIFDAVFNITTNQGPVAGILRFQADVLNPDMTIISTPSGPMTVENASLTINNVIMNPDFCSELPISGNIVITKGAETNTINFNNCEYTVD